MQTVNMHVAKTQLSRLVDAAAAGEEIIIARAGKPVARLVPLAAPAPVRKRVLRSASGGAGDGKAGAPFHCRSVADALLRIGDADRVTASRGGA